MKTNPTPQISGPAPATLSHTAIELGRKFVQPQVAKSKPPESISDTLETSDRDGDGRQPLNANQTQSPTPVDSNFPPDSTGDHLDLTA
jgi:hypothetical protein